MCASLFIKGSGMSFYAFLGWLLFCIALVVPSAVTASPIEQVYLSEAQAVKSIFPDMVSVETRSFDLSASDRDFLSQLLNTPIRQTQYAILIPKDKQSRILGHAVVLNELGKFYPITFMVGVGVDEKVMGTAVMVYREKIGAEVRKKRFLNQFRQKSLKNPLKPDLDVDCISGATVSSWTVTFGVKKALGIVHRFVMASE